MILIVIITAIIISDKTFIIKNISLFLLKVIDFYNYNLYIKCLIFIKNKFIREY
jgi:hypothetical protein